MTSDNEKRKLCVDVANAMGLKWRELDQMHRVPIIKGYCFSPAIRGSASARDVKTWLRSHGIDFSIRYDQTGFVAVERVNVAIQDGASASCRTEEEALCRFLLHLHKQGALGGLDDGSEDSHSRTESFIADMANIDAGMAMAEAEELRLKAQDLRALAKDYYQDPDGFIEVLAGGSRKEYDIAVERQRPSKGGN